LALWLFYGELSAGHTSQLTFHLRFSNRRHHLSFIVQCFVVVFVDSSQFWLSV